MDFFAAAPVAERLMQQERGSVLSHVPVKSRQNVYLHPWHLSMDESAKYGAAGKWPSTVAIRTHFPSVVRRGFESEKEALEVKYPEELHGQEMTFFCSEYIDGHAKAVMIHGVFALLDYMAPWCQDRISACCRGRGPCRYLRGRGRHGPSCKLEVHPGQLHTV